MEDREKVRWQKGKHRKTIRNRSNLRVRLGTSSCAASARVESLHNAGEVVSKTSRTVTYLTGKPGEDNSMSLTQKKSEGM